MQSSQEILSVQEFWEEYGKATKSIGYGRSGSVRLLRRPSVNNNQEDQFYAIKEYRRKPKEDTRAYRNRSTSGFCIATCLQHVNVINPLYLVQDPNDNYVEVMAYCDGGNLATLILKTKRLEAMESNCFFKQLMLGVDYLHSVGVAHRDLKPENLLLTSRGVLKIADFGEAECFRFPWEEQPRKSAGRSGTIPYMAPEQLRSSKFDPCMVDIWATGIIYMAMRTGKLLWDAAVNDEDHNYSRYVLDRTLVTGFPPIERLQDVSHIHRQDFFSITVANLGGLSKRYICHSPTRTFA